MTDTTLKLGNITFQPFEIPDKLDSLGGLQQLRIFNYVGPKKGVQVLGPKPHDIQWSGVFVYGEAIQRAKQVDQYRVQGRVQRLSWASFAYNVIVKDFKLEPIHEGQIPYTIILEVLEDLTAYPQNITQQTIDQGVQNAFFNADNSMLIFQSQPVVNPNFAATTLPEGQLDLTDPALILQWLTSPIGVL